MEGPFASHAVAMSLVLVDWTRQPEVKALLRWGCIPMTKASCPLPSLNSEGRSGEGSLPRRLRISTWGINCTVPSFYRFLLPDLLVVKQESQNTNCPHQKPVNNSSTIKPAKMVKAGERSPVHEIYTHQRRPAQLASRLATQRRGCIQPIRSTLMGLEKRAHAP